LLKILVHHADVLNSFLLCMLLACVLCFGCIISCFQSSAILITPMSRRCGHQRTLTRGRAMTACTYAGWMRYLSSLVSRRYISMTVQSCTSHLRIAIETRAGKSCGRNYLFRIIPIPASACTYLSPLSPSPAVSERAII
jgi:hypothetical protein